MNLKKGLNNQETILTNMTLWVKLIATGLRQPFEAKVDVAKLNLLVEAQHAVQDEQ